MKATIADRSAWTYEEVRPLIVPPRWVRGERVAADCSKGVQYLCRWAGAPDPMGQGFGEYGNSATICAHLQHLAGPVDLAVGDVVTFGRNGDQHAAMVLETGADPLLWSFGHQGAPNSYRLSADRREHQFLRLPVPVFVGGTDQQLRAMTGYWSWVQWRLGEGDWSGRGKADPAVRPAVPRLIPGTWWVRLGRFLKARKKPNPPNG